MNKFILERKYSELIEYVGISVREVLIRSKLPQDLFSHERPSLSIDEYINFMDVLKSLANDETAPISIGTAKNIETFTPPIFAAYCSNNALVCMKRLATYKKLIGPLVFLVNEDKDNTTLELVMENEAYQLPEFLVAIEMVFLVHLIRNATKNHIIPVDITTINKLDNPKYESFFGIKPKQGKRNILTISKNDSLLPFVSQNDSLWNYFEPELNRRLCELEVDESYSARVISALMELLPSGQSNIEDVAIKLGCSKRTLQRKLKDENTTYQKQLNHTRELLAKHYLKKQNMSSDEIAYLLGYQDLNSFIRAFNLWTGSTISEYKKCQT